MKLVTHLSKHGQFWRYSRNTGSRFASVFFRFLRNSQGNIAIMGAITLPAIALGAGVAIDYSGIYSAKSSLQQMADAAALAAAREMVLINKSAKTTDVVAKNYVLATLTGKKSRFTLGVDVKTAVDDESNIITVKLAAKRKNAFGNFLQPEYTEIVAVAKAKALAGTNICAIGLDESKKNTIRMDGDASLVANECAVYSNSTSAKGISLKKNANMQAGLICSAGGAKLSKKNLSTKPVTDCPPVDDPLSEKVSLNPGSCDHNNYSRKNKIGIVWPGTYCGGLKITGNSIVTFLPGIYVIKDGILEISGNTVAFGGYVGFYFTGNDSRMKLEKDTTISFVAPRNGPMVGMLFFQDPNAPEPPEDDDIGNDEGKFEIRSNNARTLLGTIYLPRGILKIDTDSPVAGDSAFTVVIAKRMQFKGNSKLVLNSDYSATDVPVPAGIRGQNAKVYLTQ